jgi:hypothetical protein
MDWSYYFSHFWLGLYFMYARTNNINRTYRGPKMTFREKLKETGISLAIMAAIAVCCWALAGCREPEPEPPQPVPDECICTTTISPQAYEIDIMVKDNPHVFVATHTIKWLEQELKYESEEHQVVRLTYESGRIYYAFQEEIVESDDQITFNDLQTGGRRKFIRKLMQLDLVDSQVMDLGPVAKDRKEYGAEYARQRIECPVHSAECPVGSGGGFF